jgi:CBS domain-containing protein
MQTITQILNAKSPEILTIRPSDSVFSALQIMASYNVGALPVVASSGELVGIVSERDYARKVALKGLKSDSTEVKDIMTPNVICANLTMPMYECMQLMSSKKIRHLPVVEQGELVGVLSIGDLVKAVIQDQQHQIEQLAQYIQS